MKRLNLRINFLGDSITKGGCASTEEKCYVSLIEKRTGAVCRNYGISGTRIARQFQKSQTETFDKDFCSRAELMNRDTDIIVVFGGTNDYGHGDAPLGTMTDRTPDTFYGALHYLYTLLKNSYPGALILAVTPLHRRNENNPRGEGNKAKDFPLLCEYVDAIRKVAEYHSVKLLDLYKKSPFHSENGELFEEYFADGLHPNDEGHSILADEIIKALNLEKL